MPNCIPNSVTHLIFGYYFNQPLLPNIIPNNVTHLTFGENFNQQLLPNCIPNSVTHLTFKFRFNQSLLNITSNLDELYLSEIFIKQLSHNFKKLYLINNDDEKYLFFENVF